MQRKIRRRRIVALSSLVGVVLLILAFAWPGFITSALQGDGTPTADGREPDARGTPAASQDASGAPRSSASPSRRPGPLRTPTAAVPLRLKAYGDSVGGGLCWMMQQTVAAYPVKLQVFYKPSVGLARPDYYSWPKKVRESLGHSWGAMVFMSGANDGQNMRQDGKTLEFGTKAWLTEYRRRAGALMDLALAHGVKRLYWVGMPGMSPGSGLSRRMWVVNKASQQEAKKREPFVRYVNAWRILEGPDGAFVAGYRQADGVHLNDAGTRKLANGVWRVIAAEWHFGKKASPAAGSEAAAQDSTLP